MTVAKILLIIHTLVSGQSDWPYYVKGMEAQYAQAEKDGTDTSFNNYLNRVLINHCASAKNTEKDIKTTLYLVAMYKEKDCQLPEKGESFVCKYKDKLFSIVVSAIKDNLDKNDIQELVKEDKIKNKK